MHAAAVTETVIGITHRRQGTPGAGNAVGTTCIECAGLCKSTSQAMAKRPQALPLGQTEPLALSVIPAGLPWST